ncbi:hypothetical protein [Actinacidiphila glaucinigra]|uniref:Uncharacterized protein n=1 Tax=Actinacidiphila glaucinigra TaxID=235986 RepID=A0A239LHG1_9ACTN|nr:hypothetical protein [Actinacidiphila glaucinigra]SNT30046.1 hypothetical protein SAMN05216252_12017 [Actinacidiphila glaucinigra]
MHLIAKSVTRTTVAVLSFAALSLTAPSAYADNDTIGSLSISAHADQKSRAVVAADPAAAQAASVECGSGYSLLVAERLPTATERRGTLFMYTDGGTGPDNFVCAVFDNNDPAGTRWMKLQLCENKVSSPRCDVDQGNLSQYAGPVYMDNCPKVTALMKVSSSSTTYLINRVEGSFCN